MKIHSRSLTLSDRKKYMWEGKKHGHQMVSRLKQSLYQINVDDYFGSTEFIETFEKYVKAVFEQYENFLNENVEG